MNTTLAAIRRFVAIHYPHPAVIRKSVGIHYPYPMFTNFEICIGKLIPIIPIR